MRRCTCGAEVRVNREIRSSAAGQEEIWYRVSCPVCGQTGMAIKVQGMDEDQARSEAIAAWNALIARTRSLDD